MSANWERRLGAAVVRSAFEDVTAPPPDEAPPGSEPKVVKRRHKMRLEWRREWKAATEFLFTPECAGLRSIWFPVSGIPEPTGPDAMRRAIESFAALRAGGIVDPLAESVAAAA